MSLSTLVPTQQTCAALAKWIVQGKSELVWGRMNYKPTLAGYPEWSAWQVFQRDLLHVNHSLELLDAPTASELGEILPDTVLDEWSLEVFKWESRWRADYRRFSSGLLDDFRDATPYVPTLQEALSNLVLWLAENRPEVLGEWRKEQV